MDFALSEEQRILQDTIGRFARDRLNEKLIDRDRAGTFRRDLWQACANMGLAALPVPPEYGGSGLDSLSTAIALEALGRGCRDSGLTFSLCAHLLACVVPLWKFGSEEQKRTYLPRLCDGTWIAANAMSEPGAGSDAFSLKTRALRDGDGFRLDGSKMFVTNAPVADIALVFALTDPDKGYHGGITAFLVTADTPGFRRGQNFEKMGLRTSPIGELVFEEMWLPETAVLGGVGAGAALFVHAMDWERACLVACHVGRMEWLLETAVAYARTRRQSGQSIGKFRAVSHRLATMKAELEAARLLTYRAAWQLEHSRRVSLDAAIAKLMASEALVRAALDTLQIFGGYGFLTEFEIERAVRDAVGSRIYSGTSDIQRNIIAGWLGL